MDDQTSDLESLGNHLLLLVKITIALFPFLNFIENGSDVITRLANSLFGIKHSLQVVDDLIVSEPISRIDEVNETLRLLLWTISRLFTHRR